jgi:nucleoside-diphosphate-sugar epimerase
MAQGELNLVTGGAGYFGSLLVEKLLASGARVRMFDLRPLDPPMQGVEEVLGDVRDRDALRHACRGVAVVHHNVAMVPLAKDKRAFYAVNRDGMKNVLEVAAEEGVRKIVAMSSSAVFGVPDRNPVDETTAPKPLEDYGRAKLAAEEACQEWVRRGLDVTIVRPRTILGHGRLGIMQILFEWIRNGAAVPVLGRGDNLYQFVHADDLADACIRAAARPGAAVYNIGAEKFGTMRETLAGLIAHAGTKSRVVSVPFRPAVTLMDATSRLGLSPLAAYHSLMYGRSLYFDIAKAKRELGWAPSWGNVEMFCDSYDWYVAHREAVLARRHASHHRSAVEQGVLRWVGWALRWAR